MLCFVGHRQDKRWISILTGFVWLKEAVRVGADASGVLGGELLAVFDAHRQLQTSLGVLVIELIEKVPVPFASVPEFEKKWSLLRENHKKAACRARGRDLLDRQQCFCHGWQK